MKTELILLIISLMCISSVVYWLNRLLMKSELDNGAKSGKAKSKNINRKHDWIKQRNQARWNERYKAKNEIELSRLTTGYIQVMLLLILCLVLVLLYV